MRSDAADRPDSQDLPAVVHTHCRICVALCGIAVHTEGDRVVDVKGDPDDPLSRGYTCPKGRALGAYHHDQRRLDGPLLKHDGELTATTWPGLLDDLHHRLAEILANQGADAIAIYSATGAAFDGLGRRVAEKWHRMLGSRSKYSSGTIDTPCKPLVSELMAGHPGMTPALDRENASLVVLVGINPVVSHGHLNAFPDPVVTLRDLADRGELWVIDPRSSESARLATRHLAPLPGTDYAIFAHAIRELLRRGADHEYLARHAEGVEQLTSAVEPFGRDVTAATTGLDPSDLDDFVAAIRRHGRLAGQTGTGSTMSAAANVTEWLLWALHLVTHSFDVPGGMWFHPGFLRALERRSFSISDGSAEPGPASRPELPRRLGEYPVAAMLDEIESGNIRALFVLGGNPITAFPEPDRVRKAMSQLDILAVADVVRTSATEMATHVLACADQLERADLPLFLDQFVPLVMTRYAPPVFSPKLDRRPLWWPFAKLGKSMGFDVIDGLDPDTATDDDLLRPLADRSRSTFDEIRSQRVVIADPPQLFGWVHDHVLEESRWRIAPAPLVNQLAALEGPPSVALIPRRQVRHLNSQLIEGVGGRGDPATILINPVDAHAAGVTNGNEMTVRSAHGSVVGIAEITEAIRPGAVSVPHGFEEPNVGRLTSASTDVDLLSGMVLLSGVPVDFSAEGLRESP